jgi:hypothetical protein
VRTMTLEASTTILAMALFLFVTGCGAAPAPTVDQAALEATITARLVATLSANAPTPPPPTGVPSVDPALASVAQATLIGASQLTSIPYRNITFEKLSGDDTFISLRAHVELRLNAASQWEEFVTEMDAVKVGAQWQIKKTYRFDKARDLAAMQAPWASPSIPTDWTLFKSPDGSSYSIGMPALYSIVTPGKNGIGFRKPGTEIVFSVNSIKSSLGRELDVEVFKQLKSMLVVNDLAYGTAVTSQEVKLLGPRRIYQMEWVNPLYVGITSFAPSLDGAAFHQLDYFFPGKTIKTDQYVEYESVLATWRFK